MAFEDPSKPFPQVGDSKRTGFTFRGKNIILTKSIGHPRQGLVAKGIQRGMFPEEKRVEAAAIYATTGSLPRTAELTGVPVGTLQYWRKQEDFQALLREVWAENNEKVDAKFTAIIEKALEGVLDRLENGDYKLTARGELKRVPISAKDLSLVQAINVDKRQLLRGLPTSRSATGTTVEEKTVSRLEKLAETFENLAKFGRQPRVIEAEVVEVIENHAESPNVSTDGGGTDVPSPEGRPEGQV